jgi:hypothetical protein
MQEAGLVSSGVDFKNPNFAKVAEAMGAKGIRIEEPGDAREALKEALAHRGGPVVVGVVVDAVVDPYALSRPSHIPFHTAAGFTLSLAKQVLSGEMDSAIGTIGRNVGLIRWGGARIATHPPAAEEQHCRFRKHHRRMAIFVLCQSRSNGRSCHVRESRTEGERRQARDDDAKPRIRPGRVVQGFCRNPLLYGLKGGEKSSVGNPAGSTQ